MGYAVLGITGLLLYLVERFRRHRKGLPTNAIELYNYTISNYDEDEIKALRSMHYRKYLQTYHWQLLREAVFKFYGKRCFDCHISHWLCHMEAHHLHYRNKGHEKLEDLRPLCRSCHKKRHGR